MKIVLANDHRGYSYKNEIKKYLINKGFDIVDAGCDSEESCDYPIFAKKAAQEIMEGNADYGILVCSSGEGIMIAANKVKGIRAGIGYNDKVTEYLRKHNNANMISFGSEFTTIEDILRRIDIFLSTKFEGGRHERRLKLID